MLVREEAEASAKLAGAGLGLAAPDLAAGLAVGTAAEKAARAAEDLDLVVVGLVPVVEAATAMEAAAMEAAAAAMAVAHPRQNRRPARARRSHTHRRCFPNPRRSARRCRTTRPSNRFGHPWFRRSRNPPYWYSRYQFVSNLLIPNCTRTLARIPPRHRRDHSLAHR